MAQTKHRTLRILSAVLVQSFLLQQLSYAAPSIAPTNVQFFSKPGVSLVLPESIASVEDSMHLSGSQKTLILIQDAHTNTSAQFNIAKAISHIMDKDSKTRLVFLEAAEGSDSLSFLRNYSDNNTRTRTAASFVQKGLFNGAEYLDLTSSKDIQLWGVEDKALYLKSLEAYKSVAKDREKFLTYLSQVETASEAIKGKLYGPSLQKFDAIRQKFLKEEMTITEYFDALTVWAKNTNTDLSAYPHLKALNALKTKESSINFEKANEEQIKAIASLSDTDQKELATLSQKDRSPFKLSSLNHYDKRGFYTVLKEKTSGNYPELKKYFEYLDMAKKIEAKEVLSEQKHLEDEIYAVLAKSQDEKRLVVASSNIQFLKKLFNLTATPEEFEAYKQNSSSFDIKKITGFLNKKIMDRRDLYERLSFLEEGFEETVQKAEDFYLLTHDRNEAFIQNLTQKMDQEGQKSAILITGGFHTPDLKSLLKKNNISYISITPQILHETNLKKYEELLLSQKFDAKETRLAMGDKVSANAIAAWVGGQNDAVLSQYAVAIGAPAKVVAAARLADSSKGGIKAPSAERPINGLVDVAKDPQSDLYQFSSPGPVTTEFQVYRNYSGTVVIHRGPVSPADHPDNYFVLSSWPVAVTAFRVLGIPASEYINSDVDTPSDEKTNFFVGLPSRSTGRHTESVEINDLKGIAAALISHGARLSEAPPTDADEDEAYRRAVEGTPRSAAAQAAFDAIRREDRLEKVEHALEGGVFEIPTVVTTPAPTPSAPGKLTTKTVALEGGIVEFPHVDHDGGALSVTPGNINEGARLAVSIDMPISADDTTIAMRILPGLVGLVTGSEHTGKYKGQDVRVTINHGGQTLVLDKKVNKTLPNFPLDARASHATYDAMAKQLSVIVASANSVPSAPQKIRVSVTSKLTTVDEQLELLNDVTAILSQGARLSVAEFPGGMAYTVNGKLFFQGFGDSSPFVTEINTILVDLFQAMDTHIHFLTDDEYGVSAGKGSTEGTISVDLKKKTKDADADKDATYKAVATKEFLFTTYGIADAVRWMMDEVAGARLAARGISVDMEAVQEASRQIAAREMNFEQGVDFVYDRSKGPERFLNKEVRRVLTVAVKRIQRVETKGKSSGAEAQFGARLSDLSAIVSEYSERNRGYLESKRLYPLEASFENAQVGSALYIGPFETVMEQFLGAVENARVSFTETDDALSIVFAGIVNLKKFSDENDRWMNWAETIVTEHWGADLKADESQITIIFKRPEVPADAPKIAEVGGTQESALSVDDERPAGTTVAGPETTEASKPEGTLTMPDGNPWPTFLVRGARLANIKLALEKGWVIANHIMISIHAAFISSLLSLPDNISNKWDVLKFVFTSLETPISVLFAYTSFHVGVWWHERGHYIESVKTLKLNKELLDDARKHVEMPFFKRLGWELKMFALAPLGKFEGISRHGVGYAVKARYNMSSAAAGPLASGTLAKIFLPLSAALITLGLVSGSPLFVLAGRVALGIGAVGLMDRLLADPGEVKKYKDYLANKQPTVTGSSDWESRIPAVREFIMKNRMDSVVTNDGRTVRIPWGYRNSAMGGAHTEKQFPQSNISMQEGMFIPLSAKSIAEAQEMTYALQEKLRTIIDNTQGASVLGVGLEGGLAPYIEREAGDDVPEMRLWRMMLQAITDLKYKPGVDVAIALDPATSELENEYRHKFEQPTAVGQYLFWRDKEQKVMTRDELMALYKKAIAAGIPIVSIEDGFAEDDWDGWALLKRDFNGLRVADDLATTNDETIEKIADQGLADTLLVKSNQIGSLSETLLAMMTALGKGWNLISSHRSQSPIDALEADIALGMDVMAVKIGGGGNAERMHKFIAMQMRKLKEDIRKNPSAKLEIPDAAKRAVQEGDAKAFFDQLVITGIMAFEEPTNSGVPTVGVKIMVGFPGTKYDSIFEFKAATPLGTSAGSGEAIHLTDDTIEKNAVTEKYPQLFKKRSDGTYAFYGKKDKDKEVKQSAIDEINDPELSALWKKSRRFGGKGVLNAVDNVLKTIAPEFIGKKASDLGSVADVDRSLLALELKEAAKRGKDVSDPIAIAKRKGNLGMNAILSVSLALTRFRAAADGVELSDLLRDLASQTMAKTIAAHEKKDWKEVLENSDWDELVAGLQKVNAERGEGVTLYSLLRRQLPVYDLSGARLAVEDQPEEVQLTGTAQRADMAAAVIELLAALNKYQHASIELRSRAQAADVTFANRGVIIAMLNVDPNATLVITAPQEQIAAVIRDTVSALRFVQSTVSPSTASEPVKASAPIVDADGRPIVFLVRGARLAGEDREHRISLDANDKPVQPAQTAELAYKDSSFIYTAEPLVDAAVVRAIAEDLDARGLLGRGTYQIRSTPLTGLGNRDSKTRYGAEVLSVRTNGRVVAEYVSKEPHRLDEPARSLAASAANRGPRVVYTRSGNGIRSEAPNNNLIVEEKFPDGTQLRDINPDSFTIEEKLQVADAAAALIGGMLADSITKSGVTHAFDGDSHIFVVRQKDGTLAVRMVDWAFPDFKDFSEGSAVDAVLQSLLLDRAFGKFGTHFRVRFTDKVLEAVSAAKRYAAAAAAGKSRAPVFPAGLEEFPTRGDDYGARLSAAADVRLLEASVVRTGLRERPASAFITNETHSAARLAAQPVIQNAAIKKLIDSNRESLEALVAYLVKAEEERGFALESDAAVVSTFKLQVTRESGRVVRAALVDSTGTALVTVENPLAVRASKTDAGQGVVTLLKAAEMNAGIELADIAHAPMAHGVPAGALAKFSDERVFNAQARILVQQAVSAHRQSAFANDRFYLENTEALSASQLAILSELVQKANDASRNEILIIGSADSFTGIVSRYVDADSATSPVQIDAKTFIVPVTGLEEDALVGWVRAYRAGGTIGGILEKHLSDGVILFDDVKPSDLSSVAAVVGIDAASYFRVMSQADRSVAALKRAALNIQIVRIPLEQLLNGAKIALRATGVAA